MPRESTFRGLLVSLALVLNLPGARAAALQLPPLPAYELQINLDVDQHQATVRETVTWTNPSSRPATELVFNAHSHYQIPDKDIGYLAKMVEILRMSPSETLNTDGPACDIQRITVGDPCASHAGAATATNPTGRATGIVLKPQYREDNATALVVPLPRPLARGEKITVAIDFVMHLPQKQGRWGQWKGVTFLSNWQPVLAFYDDEGWHPTPFVPWHQPFFNEAGSFHARVTLPMNQTIACTGSVVSARDLGNGWREVEINISAARDFALLCSDRYVEHQAMAGTVRVRCFAFAEHDFYGREMARIAAEAIEAYSRWFGPYPYPEFSIAESYFGWNGNECAGLVMIDERVFGMPHLGAGFVEYLVSHETCHQWWYNAVGTNGYAETWMDEGLATYFSHRLLNIKYGRNNQMLTYPKGLEWLPNIDRETYRLYGMYGTLARGEASPVVQEMDKFDHIVNLFSMCYDRGSKVVGMIEDRLGEAAFLDFMRKIYAKYYFRILRVHDFQRELEEYTGQKQYWEEFFKHWLYSADQTDWCVESVKIDEMNQGPRTNRVKLLFHRDDGCTGPCKVTVLLHQKAEYTEQTVMGISLDESKTFPIRIPILPHADIVKLDNPPATVVPLGDNRFQVEVFLPCRPTQIAVDPDHVLVDKNPANNLWKPEVCFRFTPFYTLLDETDLTTAYDRWNIICGLWFYTATFGDPWFTRSDVIGFRVGAYRTQEFAGGAYLGFRTDYRDLVVGVDGLWDHWPWAHTQVGINAEQSLTPIDNDRVSDRAIVFGRYVFQYSDSLYLPPMHYLEVFTGIQDNALPLPRNFDPEANHFDQTSFAGVHYHIDYLTPYWDPEGGFRVDGSYTNGLPILGEHEAFYRLDGSASYVVGLPDGLGWLSDTRLATRFGGGAAWPTNGELFTLGGSQRFRGFDLKERQGSMFWAGSVEWRFPVARGLTWDCIDHTLGVRNLYGATFYDAGEMFLQGHSVGGVAHALGVGLGVDVAWFSFVERTMLRLDIAKTINASSPVQVWFGLQVPF
jgi:hypothetical protein